MSNLTRGRKNIGESGRTTAAGAGQQLLTLRAGAEAEPQTLGKCSELSCSIPRGAGAHHPAASCTPEAVLAPQPDRGRERASGKTANHQGLVSARHRAVLAEPDTYLLFTVTSLSTRVIPAWL